MSLVLGLVNVYIIYYTIMYSIKLYKEDNNKFAGIVVFMLAALLAILPVLVRMEII